MTMPAHAPVCTHKNRGPQGEFLEGALLIQKEGAFAVLGNTATLAF